MNNMLIYIWISLCYNRVMHNLLEFLLTIFIFYLFIIIPPQKKKKYLFHRTLKVERLWKEINEVKRVKAHNLPTNMSSMKIPTLKSAHKIVNKNYLRVEFEKWSHTDSITLLLLSSFDRANFIYYLLFPNLLDTIFLVYYLFVVETIYNLVFFLLLDFVK